MLTVSVGQSEHYSHEIWYVIDIFRLITHAFTNHRFTADPNPMTDLRNPKPIETVYCLLNLFITLHKMKFITGITSDNMHGFVI